MPRTARSVQAGSLYHVINRGNQRQRIFRKPGDYVAFEKILAEGLTRFPVKLLAYCLMPNHWHLLLEPAADDALGRFIGWVCVTHVRRHHAHYHIDAGGHLYQGRFKSFPVQTRCVLAVARYVEGNPRRANLVTRAEMWPHCSLARRLGRGSDVAIPLSGWGVRVPEDWIRQVNDPIDPPTLAELRTCTQRGRPFGTATWVLQAASRMNLDYTLRPRGRPRKNESAEKKE